MPKTKPDTRTIERAARHRFPMLFDPKNPLALKVGVHRDLAAALGITVRDARAFLKRWTGAKPYLTAVTKDVKRYSLQGDPVEIITAKDKESAQNRLDGQRRTK